MPVVQCNTVAFLKYGAQPCIYTSAIYLSLQIAARLLQDPNDFLMARTSDVKYEVIRVEMPVVSPRLSHNHLSTTNQKPAQSPYTQHLYG